VEKLFTLESYKNYLIGYYANKFDIGKEEERKAKIESTYSDDYLDNVVLNTEKFLLDILKDMLSRVDERTDRVCFKKEISSWVYKRISNGCSGGWAADELICPDESNLDVLVSPRLLKSFFGSKFVFEISEDIIEKYDEEEDVGSIDGITWLNIEGPKSAFMEILNSKFPKGYCLVKK